MFSVEFSPFLAGILSPEICLGGFGSSDVSRSSLVFLKREILTPKSLRGLSVLCSVACSWLNYWLVSGRLASSEQHIFRRIDLC